MPVQLPQPIQFGKYTLFERIGRGGMADVYKGRIQGPAGFERVFVIKRILPHLSDEPTFIKMFVEEAKLSARLNHPNIVQIFELGAVESEYFISMEYVRGHDLAETMRAIWKTMGPPRPELVAYIGREACRALNYAHTLNDDHGKPLRMIHRDVSPSNIMLSYEGSVKLLDFGIAKALGEAPETTKSGTMKGKYAYMAPEQTEGDDVDSRIDIFSCGIVLHEVLTGRRLFKGTNDVQTIERVRRCEVPAPSQLNPMCPPELDAIVLKALAKDRDDRFANAAEMADAMDDVVHNARFQPTHLSQLLHELFPLDGSAAPVSRPTTNTSSHSTGSGVASSVRSPTVPPARSPSSYSLSNASSVPATKARPRWQIPAATALALVIGGTIVWRATATNKHDGSTAAVSDPARRFHVFVKSDPPGADIFLRDAARPLAATPVTIPVDLTGVTSVKITLKKDGFEDYEQIISSDMPLSINLRPTGEAAAAAAAPAPAAPAPVKPAKPKPTEEPEATATADRTTPKPAPVVTPADKVSSNNRAPKHIRPKKAPGTSTRELVDPF